jgi:hypothetical protein
MIHIWSTHEKWQKHLICCRSDSKSKKMKQTDSIGRMKDAE